MQENFYQTNNVDASRQMQSGMQQPTQQQTNLGQMSVQMPQQQVPQQQMNRQPQMAPQQVPPQQKAQPRMQQQMPPQQVPPQMYQTQQRAQQQVPPQVQPQQVPQQQVPPQVQQQVPPQQMNRQPQMAQQPQMPQQQVPPQVQPQQVPPQQMAQPRMQQQANQGQSMPQQMNWQAQQPQQMNQQPRMAQQRQQWKPVGQQVQTGQKDVEKTIGKTVMGICASVLIFISFIFFAALVFPFLNDVVKMIVMYGFSAVFTLVGGLLLMRDKENMAFIALTGCGIGAIYISTIISALCFGVMNDIVLYSCLFLWAVLVCVLSRLRSNVFLIIGQIGINISMIVAVGFGEDQRDANEFLFFVGYNLIAQLIFYFSHFRREYKQNLINQIGWAVGLYAVLVGSTENYAMEGLVGVCIGTLVVLTALVPIGLSLTVHRVDEKQNATFGLFNSLYLWAGFYAYSDRLDNDIAYVLALLVFILFLVVLELRIPQMNHAGKVVLQCTVFLMLDLALISVDFLEKYAAMAPLAMGCFVYGFCRKNTVYKIAGLAYVVLLLSNPMSHGAMVVWAVLLTVCVVVLWACDRQQYRPWMKAVGYPILLYILLSNILFITEDFWDIGEWEAVLAIAIPAVLNAIVSKIPILYRDLRTGEEEREFRIETGVIQIVLIVVSYLMMATMRDLGTTIVMIMLGAIVTFTNCYSVIKRDETGWMGIYVATKVVLWAFFALIALEAPSILVSVIGLLVALGCIVVGFAAGMQTGRSLKQIRIFGLVMVLICLLKLILIDLPYDSILLRAISFFISGVLCFAISLIYNMVDKHLMKNGNRG